MKLRITHSILFILFISIGISQGRMGDGRPEPIDWAKMLDLSEEQAKKMIEINQGFRNEIMAMREKASGDPMAMMANMQEKQKQRDKAVKKVLSKKQFKKYKKELKSQQKERRKRMGGKNNGQGRGLDQHIADLVDAHQKQEGDKKRAGEFRYQETIHGQTQSPEISRKKGGTGNLAVSAAPRQPYISSGKE